MQGVSDIEGQLILEHPPQSFSGGAAFLCAAFPGAVDKIARAKPATKSKEAFMTSFSQIPGQQMPSRSV